MPKRCLMVESLPDDAIRVVYSAWAMTTLWHGTQQRTHPQPPLLYPAGIKYLNPQTPLLYSPLIRYALIHNPLNLIRLYPAAPRALRPVMKTTRARMSLLLLPRYLRHCRHFISSLNDLQNTFRACLCSILPGSRHALMHSRSKLWVLRYTY